MNQGQRESDVKIMARLRAPIDDLVSQYCPNKTRHQQLRLRQLTWQAVDVLVRTGNVVNLNQEKDIKRITRNIKEVGASEKFIEASLRLAVRIYQTMLVDYPGLLKRYKG